MSVVNKMLQDLDARNAQSDTLAADYTPPAKKSAMPYILLILAVVIAAAVIFTLLWNSQQGSNEHLARSVKVMEPSPLPANSLPASKPEILPSQEQRQAPRSETTTSNDSAAPEPPSELEQNTQVDKVEKAPIAAMVENSRKDTVEAKVVEETKTKEKSTSVLNIKAAQQPKTISEYRQQAQAAIAEGDDRGAIEALTALVNLQPDNYAASKKLAAILFSQGMLEQAEQSLQNALAVSPNNPELQLMLARLYFQQDKKQLALTTLTTANVSAELYPDYVSFRASLAESSGQFVQSRSDYLALALSQPNEAKWWLGLAISEERSNNTTAALQAYKRVKELNQLSVQVHEFVQQRIAFLTGK